MSHEALFKVKVALKALVWPINGTLISLKYLVTAHQFGSLPQRIAILLAWVIAVCIGLVTANIALKEMEVSVFTTLELSIILLFVVIYVIGGLINAFDFIILMKYFGSSLGSLSDDFPKFYLVHYFLVGFIAFLGISFIEIKA